MDILNRIVPYRDFRPRVNSRPWMCGEILSGIKKRDSLFARFKRDRSNVSLYKEYCSQRNLVQRDIKFAKSDYFRRKITESGHDSSKLWRQLGSLGYSKKGEGNGKIVLEEKIVHGRCGNALGKYPGSLGVKIINSK